MFIKICFYALRAVVNVYNQLIIKRKFRFEAMIAKFSLKLLYLFT